VNCKENAVIMKSMRLSSKSRFVIKHIRYTNTVKEKRNEQLADSKHVGSCIYVNSDSTNAFIECFTKSSS